MDKLIAAQHYTVWSLIKTYWQSQHRLRAYLVYVLLVILTVAVVETDVALTYWSNYFYNALQAYDKHEALFLLGVFMLLALFYISLLVIRFFTWQMFGLHWRRWLTEQVIGRWLQKRGYYYLENFDEKTDNPDQRIQDDVGTLIANSIDLSLSLIGNILTFVSFIYVLWSLSGVLTIPLGSWGEIHIHGYLVWISVLYSLFGTAITFKVGRPLVNLNFEQQRREATFRYAAIDLRSHAEDVALYRGEEHQKSILRKLFDSVLDNTYAIILRSTGLLTFTSFFGQVSVILPFLVVMPNYFNKVFLLGGLMQSLRAFNSVQDSLSFIINSYIQIAQWQATGRRLTTFLNPLTDVEEKVEMSSNLVVANQNENKITTRGLSLSTPRNELLLRNIDETFTHGTNYLIKGVSGIGKSTFLRTLAGIWPYVKGEIVFPEKHHVMFLPQLPYMPIGTLAETIMFPDKHEPALDARLVEVLRDCKLENFIPRLHDTAPWAEQLSPGEQQRIAFARVLLHKPDWVFMDESTSMLDLASEVHLYKMLKQKLPGCSLVSVGHRPSLDALHDHIVDMTKYSERMSPQPA